MLDVNAEHYGVSMYGELANTMAQLEVGEVCDGAGKESALATKAHSHTQRWLGKPTSTRLLSWQSTLREPSLCNWAAKCIGAGHNGV